MAAHGRSLALGLPRIRNEPQEVRDFLPSLASAAAEAGAEVYVETGYGSGMGFRDSDYSDVSASVHIVDRERAHSADIVLVLRPSTDSFELLRAGTTFIAMLHFLTHKERARHLKELGIDAIALDLIVDDEGLRLVEDMRSVAWNGLDVAFGVLERTRDTASTWEPTRVTVLGAGMVGKHAVEAATKFGNLERAERYRCEGVPGVEVVTVGRNLSANEPYMSSRLHDTDVLVDAAARSDTARPLVPNTWLADLPDHAVLADLAVDHYLLDEDPAVVRGIEGIPAGDLAQYVFAPHDPAWDRLPPEIPTEERRWVVSCYGWPGVEPLASVAHYGRQLEPLLVKLVERGGARFLRADDGILERALHRGTIAEWIARL